MRNFRGLIVPLLLLCVWEASVRLGGVPSWLLPAPSQIATTAWAWRNDVGVHFAATLQETLLGFSLAVGLGVPIALLLVYSEKIEQAIEPLLAGLQAVPKNAVAPLFIVWFGAGEISKVAITFLISFFPIVVNTTNGMKSTDLDMVRLMKSLRATTKQIYWHARIPNGLPYFFSACKISITLALIGAVIGEFVGSDVGLGYLILIASAQLKTDLAFVSIVILAVSGVVLFRIVTFIEGLVVPWAKQEDTFVEGL